MKDAQFLASITALVRANVPEYRNASDEFIVQRIRVCLPAIDEGAQMAAALRDSWEHQNTTLRVLCEIIDAALARPLSSGLLPPSVTTTSMANIFAEKEERAMCRGKIDTILEMTPKEILGWVRPDDWTVVSRNVMAHLGIVFSADAIQVDSGSWFMGSYLDRANILKGWLRIEKSKVS